MSYSASNSNPKSKLFFWIHLIGSIVLCQLALNWFDWWIIIPVIGIFSFLLAHYNSRPFGWGFLAMFLLWGFVATYHNMKNDGELANRMVQLFPLPQNGWWMVAVTALWGGLIGGFTALSFYYLRKWITPVKRNPYY